uniref:F-box domain-containing protein n=1 Tax=Aegilops tauschii subsp. strangulata TaxID=200361 RepID=A0A453M4W5_AEGTS
MGELAEDLFLRLAPELVDAVLLRLPPGEPACLVRASVVCKPWFRILADPGFRRRYLEFHRTPSVLGLFEDDGAYVSTSALPSVHPGRGRLADRPLDCRHGRALLAPYSRSFREGNAVILTVLDPLTGRLRRVLSPVDEHVLWFSAAVLCAAQGCDHYGCQGGHFRLAVVTTSDAGVTSGWLYSSETRVWSELTTVGHPKVAYYANQGAPSVLVRDALYFNIDGIIELHLGEAGPKGAMVWTKLRVIDLKKLLPAGALMTQTVDYGINGVAEGTQVIFVSTFIGSYMVDLKSRQVRMVSGRGRNITPYTSFYIPAIKAASPSQGQRAGASSVRRAGARGRR